MIQGQRDDAQKAFESCIEVMKYTNGGSYLDRLGNYYDVSGLSSEATQRLDDLSHMPSHVENENQKNWSNPKSQQASTPLEKEGEKLLKKAQAALATPKNTWAATWHSRAAIAYVVLENLDAAQKESMEAIQADPANPGIYNFAASIAGRKDAPRQIELLRKSLSLDNANPYTHYKLGEALEAAGNLVEARTEYSICLSLMSRLRNKTYYEDPTHGIHLLEGLQQNARDRKKALDAILATVQSQPKS